MKLRRPRVALAAACVAVAALLTAWIFSAAPPAVPASARDDVFALPAKLRADPDQLVASLTKFDPWGLGPAAYARPRAAGERADPVEQWIPWRLTGSYATGKRAFVLISFQGRTSEPLAVGDSLPGGARILEIQQDRICILINGKRRALEIRAR